ncbi:hypothetical protein SAMD00023353_3700090 [Rosellinia necatrix]|uniref:Uncharacterized protein n=1 Tax=Rosellinia necatrix TaxID=77044 RepID=A0A1S8AA35_ROSNE|nr:hypothetical protein SAMD00023353_3700090 [Rosellinia necatrix]
MDGRGDINLARELQAQFGKAKPSRRRGHRVGGKDRDHSQPQPMSRRSYQEPSSFRFQDTAHNQGRGQQRSQVGASSIVRRDRPSWQGQLVTNDSPGKNF